MPNPSSTNEPKKIRDWPWPDPASPHWLFDMDLVYIHGLPKPIGLAIKQAPGREPEPITGTLLRSIPLASMTRAAATQSGARQLAIEEEAKGLLTTFDAAEQKQLQAAQLALETPGWTPYANPRDTSFFRYLADLYRNAQDYSRRPAHLVAVLLDANPSTTRGWISRTRELGYLPQHPRHDKPSPDGIEPEEVTD